MAIAGERAVRSREMVDMEVTRAVTRFAAIVCIALIAMFACVGTAFAATVHGADCNGAGAALESGEIDVLNVDGSAGETVFLAVKQGSQTLAKNLPYTIGENAESGDKVTWTGVATIDIANLNLDALDGSYEIEAYATRAGGKLLYQGGLYGVYADLPDGASKLIGTRVVDATEMAGREFNPPETLYTGGRTYRLAGSQDADSGALHYIYEEYDEATTVDGVIRYTDANGDVVASTKIPGLAYGEERAVEIPSIVKADDGGLYRTVFFKKSVTASNPGQTSFSVYCAQMSEADQALSGFYVATIQMVDEQGGVIASDSVNVTGEFVYTAPSVIYKTVTDSATAESRVVTYNISQSATIRLSAANDGVLNRARTIQVSYSTQEADAAETTVTFNLIDGSKDPVDEKEARDLGQQQVVVTSDSPTAMPQAEIEVGGTTYYLAGDPEDYAYTRGSGEVPSINVYYTPEGYSTDETRDVTVNYVNFSTDEVIESHTYTSDAGDNSRIIIDTPETFSAGDVDYVRLAGQEDAIQHSYYSGIASYTVYYRDKNDTLSSGTVINRIRVVYEGGSTSGGGSSTSTTTETSGGTAAESAASASSTAAAENASGADDATAGAGGADAGTTDAGAAAAAGADAAQNLQLNDARTYNVMDGEDGNATLTNESGVDSNTERIADSETPLASGFDAGATSSAASSFLQIGQMLVPLGIGAVVAAIGIAALVVIRRRNRDEYDL